MQAIKVEKAEAKVEAAAKDASKIDMRRQVVQGQLDMVTKMNEKAALDERDIEVTQPLASRRLFSTAVS